MRDALRRARRQWLKLFETNAQLAQDAGTISSEPPAAVLAFETDAVLPMANVNRNINDDIEALHHARHLIELRLQPPTALRQ